VYKTLKNTSRKYPFNKEYFGSKQENTTNEIPVRLYKIQKVESEHQM
jgi:hypothetical protein